MESKVPDKPVPENLKRRIRRCNRNEQRKAAKRRKMYQQFQAEMQMRYQAEMEMRYQAEMEMRYQPEMEMRYQPEMEMRYQPEMEMKYQPEMKMNITAPEIKRNKRERLCQRRVLTEVQMIPEPIVAPAPEEQHVVQQPSPQPPPQPPPPVVQQNHNQSLTPAAATPQAVPQVSSILTNAGVGEVIELNSSNAANFATEHSDILLAGTSSQWHQIIINTPVMEEKREYVILAINKQISPLKLNPYFFRMENNRITFFVNMCGLAMKALCKRDLKVPYVSDKFVEIEMTVKLFSKNCKLSATLKEIISRRLDSQNKFLDLSYIKDIPEIREMLFYPIDNWNILELLLRIAEVMAPGLTALGLAGNGIVSPTSLWHFLSHSKWKALQTLDLSDNEIQSTGKLSVPRTLQIQISELYLDYNPLCKSEIRHSYLSAIRATFPHLAKLDGTYLHAKPPSLPYWLYWKPNFIVSSTGDSGEFADQFVEHFFTLYDGADRMKLRGLYHKRAYFSMSCLCLDAQSTTPDSRLTAYMADSRNLLRCSDMKKARTALTCGSEKILERLLNLPNTQHDPYTFTVDLTVHTPELTVLTVTGVFCDIAEEKSSHRHFSRTFVLTGRGNDEYQITNDILYVSNATTREAEEAFRFGRPTKHRPVPILSESEKEFRTGFVQQLTSMSAPWSRKCLEDTDWDLKEALEIFMELYETSKIPKSAFVSWEQ